MNRWTRGVHALILAALLPASAWAGGFNLAGVGMKALAMSGAYRAVADDWSAMYWNPAGLAGQGSGVWIETKALYPITTITPDAPSTVAGYDYYLYRNGVEQTSTAKWRPTGSAAFMWQFSEDLTAGLSLYTPSALGADWENLYLGPYVGYGDNPAYPDQAWESSMFVLDIHPTIGYRVNDKLRVGVGLSIKYTDITLGTPALIAGRNPADGSRLPLPASHFFVDAVLSGTGTGYGFNAGVLYDVTENFHIAATYTGAVDVPIEGTIKQDVYLPALAGSGTLTAEPDATTDFPIPMEVGFGLAYDVSDALVVAADLRWVSWGSLDVVPIEVDGSDPTGQPADDTELILDWEDTIRYNLGVAWDSSDKLQLRCGYYFDPTPIPTETIRPTITDVADKHSFSLGAMYDFGNGFTLEGTYQQLLSGTNDVPSSDNDNDGLYDNVPGEWSMNVVTIGVQLGYRF